MWYNFFHWYANICWVCWADFYYMQVLFFFSRKRKGLKNLKRSLLVGIMVFHLTNIISVTSNLTLQPWKQTATSLWDNDWYLSPIYKHQDVTWCASMKQYRHQVNKDETAEMSFCCLCGHILESGLMSPKWQKNTDFKLFFYWILHFVQVYYLYAPAALQLHMEIFVPALQNTILLKNVKLRY